MGRPKSYATAAARQAAYRQRLRDTTVLVDRQALDQLHQRLGRLQEALYAARAQGDPLATAAYRAHVETMLDQLTVVFHARAAALTTESSALMID